MTSIYGSRTNYGLLNIVSILNSFAIFKYLYKTKIQDISNLRLFSMKIYDIQEFFCQDGGKKTEKVTSLVNPSYTRIRGHSYFYDKSSSFKLEKKLNSAYLNLSKKKNYRYYSIQNLSKDNKSKNIMQKWPNTETLLRLKSEVIQEQIALVNLAVSKGLHHKSIKNLQTRLMRSLKFRIVAVDKAFKNRFFTVMKRNCISFKSNLATKRRIYWKVVAILREITYYSLKDKVSITRKIRSVKIEETKKRLQILTMIDRALQQLISFILEPLVECTSDYYSFGFRRYRSPQMAIGIVKKGLEMLKTKNRKSITQHYQEKGLYSIKPKKKIMLIADIKILFDNINDDYLLKNLFLPQIGLILVKKWLRNKVVEKNIFCTTLDGTFQGNIIFPIFINFILNGLEDVVYKSFSPFSKSKNRLIITKDTDIRHPSYLEVIRYAENLIVFSRNKCILKDLVLYNLKIFLTRRGLHSSLKKIKFFCLTSEAILHFLGYMFYYREKRKIPYITYSKIKKIILYPNKIEIYNLIKKLKKLFDKSINLKSYYLIAKINPILKDWAYRFNVSNQTNYKGIIKNLIYQMAWKWARRKHKQWGKKKITNHYFWNKKKS